jgi:hypothetical protein
MGSLPAESEVVVAVAIPPVRLEVPNTVLPVVNVTVPVALDGRVAVKVTAWPTLDGFREEVKVTVGVALLTVWVRDAVAEL